VSPIRISVISLNLAVSVAMAVILNLPFWNQFETIYDSPLFTASAVLLLSSLNMLVLTLISWRRIYRPLLGLLLLISCSGAYFIHSYGIAIDSNMLRNVLETDPAEAFELITPTMVLLSVSVPLVLLVFFRNVKVVIPVWHRSLIHNCGLFITISALCAGNIFLFYQQYADFARNHKPVRYFVLPHNVLWASSSLAAEQFQTPIQPYRQIAQQSTPGPLLTDSSKPSLLVLVVGETARAANFSLNGYPRQTNPKLSELGVTSYQQVSACGTSTAVSLPCMFSASSRTEYDHQADRNKENLLDLIARAGLKVLWVDNNSGCKGVCERIETLEIKHQPENPNCIDGECYDETMLSPLAEVINNSQGHTVVVLHQKGSHGPAYDRRYPDTFRQFTPVCETSQLSDCAQQSVVNAYDNTILYTDHLLARIISMLNQQQRFNSGMLYVSDHGESLGENNLYLHGMPYALAPDFQKQIPMISWFDEGFKQQHQITTECQNDTLPLSHDHLFHSVLSLLGVKTELYQRELDLFSVCRPDGH